MGSKRNEWKHRLMSVGLGLMMVLVALTATGMKSHAETITKFELNNVPTTLYDNMTPKMVESDLQSITLGSDAYRLDKTPIFTQYDFPYGQDETFPLDCLKMKVTFTWDSSKYSIEPYGVELWANGTKAESAQRTGWSNNWITFQIPMSVEHVSYEIIDGEDGEYTKGSGEELTFRASGAMDQCTGVKVDGELLDSSNYTLASGSTIVTLSNDYLETLEAGEHELAVMYGNLSATTTFTILEAEDPDDGQDPADPGDGSGQGGSDAQTPDQGGQGTDGQNQNGQGTAGTTVQPAGSSAAQAGQPNTGDDSNLAGWLALLVVAGGLATVAYRGKKRAQ